jgi:hypothetical protein
VCQGTVDAEMTPGATRGQTRGSFATKKRCSCRLQIACRACCECLLCDAACAATRARTTATRKISSSKSNCDAPPGPAPVSACAYRICSICVLCTRLPRAGVGLQPHAPSSAKMRSCKSRLRSCRTGGCVRGSLCNSVSRLPGTSSRTRVWRGACRCLRCSRWCMARMLSRSGDRSITTLQRDCFCVAERFCSQYGCAGQPRGAKPSSQAARAHAGEAAGGCKLEGAAGYVCVGGSGVMRCPVSVA